MYGRSSADRSIVDKMMRLFIVQAISGFVSRDFDTGIHFLNEVKTHFAQNQSQLNPVLKGLAKDIIQSLDMLQPGASADVFANHNASTPTTPQSELASILGNKAKKQEVVLPDLEGEIANPEVAEVLRRRKLRNSGLKEELDEKSLEDELNIGEFPLDSEELQERRKRRKRSELWDEL
ncbi:MAG: hypothetical protein D6732_21600 [Methanobacteriota archaeon]|nr:MAG: hypothetical protein D6732_21600 [Euryarchaeota archaeon]